MREKKKTSILLCEKHFKQFCYGLVKEDETKWKKKNIEI